LPLREKIPFNGLLSKTNDYRNQNKKNPLVLLPLTTWAEPEKIQAVGENSVAGLTAYLIAQAIEVDEGGIGDSLP
jgi:hypothetical protein